MIEGKFMKNLRRLLVLVVFLGIAQYLVGSFVLQTNRGRVSDTSTRNNEHMLPAIEKNMKSISKGETMKNSSHLANAEFEMQRANFTRFFFSGRWVRRFTQITKREEDETNSTIFCKPMQPELGPFQVNISPISLRDVEGKYPEVNQGGYYKPTNCTAIHKVAIIVPYRDRIDHLAIFLNNIHPFLMKQQIEYRIFIVEQRDSGPFNRGKLFNIGFVESQKLGYHCFVFHDVDLLPLDTRNVYSCPRQPRHMARTNNSYHNFRSVDDEPEEEDNESEFVGVVTAMTEDQFRRVNGFSNKYKNWGGEDEDMSIRLRVRKLEVARYDPSFGRYLTLNHTKFVPDPERSSILKTADTGFLTDGLNTLEYEILSTNENHLYTHWIIDINKQGKSTFSLKLGFISGS